MPALLDIRLSSFAVLVLAALAVAAPGQAVAAGAERSTKPPRHFVGLQSWDIPTAADFQRLGRARVRTFRMNLLWERVEARQGAPYDWSYWDKVFGEAAAAGVRILPVVFGSPPWTPASRPQAPPRTPEGRAALYRFAAAAVGRYGPGGTFWAARPQLRRSAAVYWQVWNEPSHPLFWDGPNPAEYARLLIEMSRAMRTANRRVRIVFAGLPNGPLYRQDRFLKLVYRQPGARRAFDVMAVHSYSGGYRNIIRSLERTRAVMRRRGDRRKPLMLTEFGWASGGAGPPYIPIRSPAGQASELRRAYRQLISKRRRYRLLAAVWFSYRDRAPWPDELISRSWQWHTGLFTTTDRAKPGWRALRRVSAR